MKVIALIGSGRKRHTYQAVEKFFQNLQEFGNVKCEIVQLSDYKLEICQGCSLCLNKGEEFCPLVDDRDVLLEKIENADGIVFATPNYSFSVSGLMKVFLDRLGFVFHRPRYFGKVFTNIVVQGVYRGNQIVKYLNFIGNALGTNVKGTCLNSREPLTEKTKRKNELMLQKHCKKFYHQITKKELPTPTVFEIMIFRMARNGIRRELSEEFRDYNYYKEKGWFDSDFYYSVQLNLPKKLLGKLFDRVKM